MSNGSCQGPALMSGARILYRPQWTADVAVPGSQALASSSRCSSLVPRLTAGCAADMGMSEQLVRTRGQAEGNEAVAGGAGQLALRPLHPAMHTGHPRLPGILAPAITHSRCQRIPTLHPDTHQRPVHAACDATAKCSPSIRSNVETAEQPAHLLS